MDQAEIKLMNSSIEMRKTEREMIADKDSNEKKQAHIKAKLVWRDAADVMIKRGVNP